jgi:hypothetical protein
MKRSPSRRAGGRSLAPSAPRYIRNAGRTWSAAEVRRLRQLAGQNTPTRVIGLKLGRPVAGVYAKAAERRISLRPANQSPRTSRRSTR